MSDEFKVGDAVELKTGGPQMTYVGDDELGQAICVWFDGGKKSDSFPKVALRKAGSKSGNIPLVRG